MKRWHLFLILCLAAPVLWLLLTFLLGGVLYLTFGVSPERTGLVMGAFPFWFAEAAIIIFANWNPSVRWLNESFPILLSRGATMLWVVGFLWILSGVLSRRKERKGNLL